MLRHCLPILGALIMLIGCSGQTIQVTPADNPLLVEFDTPYQVPPFDHIEPYHFEPAFRQAMQEQLVEVRAIAENPEAPTFENTIAALDRSGALLRQVDLVFGGLTGANTSEELQAVNKVVQPLLAAHRDELRMNAPVFQRIKAVHDQRHELGLDAERLYLLENLYKERVRSGALLSAADQERLRAINGELSSLRVQFGDNVLAETNGFELVLTDRAQLAGLPDGVIEAATATATERGHDGAWVFTTHKPSMLPFLTYAQDRELRRQLYTAYLTRGNNGNERDNTEILSRVIALRLERSRLLGYDTYADYELERRMSGTPQRVYDLLDRLWTAALPVAERERAEMQAIIDAEGGGFQLASHDWWYYAEKLRLQKYQLDDNELRPYFALDQVRDGVFWVANQLYGLTFEPLAGLPLPHEEAEVFRVLEADGSHCGVIYMDYHPRASKRGGAWCGSYVRQNRADGHETDPIVNLVCNFTRPTADAPALLSLDEVETLFHEFGHALDNLCSDVTHRTLFRSADFSELPSQIMEHWAMEPVVLQKYARHYQTGEAIPQALMDKIAASKHFNQGFATVEYLAASLLDMKLHTLTDAEGLDVMALEKEYLDSIGLIPEIAPRYHSTYFGHILGGYAAGYYGYIWCGVLDCDAFQAFKETSLFDQDTARRFRQSVLARNGTADFMKMYVDFRGREPEIEPLLRKRGLM